MAKLTDNNNSQNSEMVAGYVTVLVGQWIYLECVYESYTKNIRVSYHFVENMFMVFGRDIL